MEFSEFSLRRFISVSLCLFLYGKGMFHLLFFFFLNFCSIVTSVQGREREKKKKKTERDRNVLDVESILPIGRPEGTEQTNSYARIFLINSGEESIAIESLQPRTYSRVACNVIFLYPMYYPTYKDKPKLVAYREIVMYWSLIIACIICYTIEVYIKKNVLWKK